MYVTDDNHSTKGRYGRLLVYIFDNDGKSFFNADMVKWGYAFAYKRFPFKFKKQFICYEKRAKKKKGRLLWGGCSKVKKKRNWKGWD